MKKLIYLMLLGAFISCEPNDPVDGEEISEEICEYPIVDVINSDLPMVEINYNSSKIMVQEYENYYIFEGDILIPMDAVNTNKSVGRTTGLWPDNIIIYAVDPLIQNKTRITDAIKHWEATTNVRFKLRTSERDYVYFMYSDSGCASYIGKIGGRQDIWLSDACSTGSTIHEIGHAAGLFHEQTRSDRDNYVRILYENITSGREHNFALANTTGVPTKDLTPTLDFGSIMLYSSYSFSKNGLPTMVRLDGSTFQSQRTKLSVDDVKGINMLYPATTTTPTPTPDPDTDGDGTLDKDDKCPTISGPKDNLGCPYTDTDKDGTPDKDDKCPLDAGPTSNGGCPITPPTVKDTDGDGVIDTEDSCPTQAGPVENKGCPWPDTDKDGVVDKDDNCPTVVGPKENAGCPWPEPDTDGDGLLDKDDKCPTVAGPKENGGCPWPDTDKDGILDKDDKCPTEAGPASNQGCPVEPEPVEPPPTTEYINGQCYVIAGTTVLRNNNKWYVKKGKKWMEVELINGKWKPIKGKKN